LLIKRREISKREFGKVLEKSFGKILVLAEIAGCKDRVYGMITGEAE